MITPQTLKNHEGWPLFLPETNFEPRDPNVWISIEVSWNPVSNAPKGVPSMRRWCLWCHCCESTMTCYGNVVHCCGYFLVVVIHGANLWHALGPRELIFVSIDRQAPIFPTRLDKKTLLPETSQIPKEKPLTPVFSVVTVWSFVDLFDDRRIPNRSPLIPKWQSFDHFKGKSPGGKCVFFPDVLVIIRIHWSLSRVRFCFFQKLVSLLGLSICCKAFRIGMNNLEWPRVIFHIMFPDLWSRSKVSIVSTTTRVWWCTLVCPWICSVAWRSLAGCGGFISGHGMKNTTRVLWILSCEFQGMVVWYFTGAPDSIGVSKNKGTPKSSILIGFSMIFTIHFGGPPLFLQTPICPFQEKLRICTHPLEMRGWYIAPESCPLDW